MPPAAFALGFDPRYRARLHEFTAALGLVQVERLEEIVAWKNDRIMSTGDDLPNSDWVAANHWCVPLYYRPEVTV